jgi:IS605 OrfB family transposase
LTPITVYVPEHNAPLLTDWLSTGQAYSIEVRRCDGRFYCHITLDLPEIKHSGKRTGIAGFDVNPQGVAVTVIHLDGNYRASRWFSFPELVDVSSNKRDWLIGNRIRDAVRWAKSRGAQIAAVERLRFGQTHDTNRSFNRITHAFAHRKLIETVYTRCWKEGLELKAVNPAFSSIIGRVKYAETYGLSDHQAAALVIARRALGFRERVPLALTRAVFDTEDRRSSWRAWGEVAKWLAFVRRHATRNGQNLNTWSLSDYLQYPVRPQ